MSKVCQNCGREHEGQLIETFRDGDNLPVDIIVCDHARYEEEAPKQLDEDAFNDAIDRVESKFVDLYPRFVFAVLFLTITDRPKFYK